MKEIDFTKQILKYREDGLLADEKAGYPPNCKPGHELSKDKKKLKAAMLIIQTRPVNSNNKAK